MENVYLSAITVPTLAEVGEIKQIVNEFIELKKARTSSQENQISAELDEKINNLELVKIHCTQKISTLELADEKNSYQRLQQLCPILKDLPISKAVQLFNLI